MLDIWDHHEPLLPMQVVAHPLYTLNNQGGPFVFIAYVFCLNRNAQTVTLQARGGEYEISSLVVQVMAGPPNPPHLRFPRPPEIAGLIKDLVYEPFLNKAGYFLPVFPKGGTLGGG